MCTKKVKEIVMNDVDGLSLITAQEYNKIKRNVPSLNEKWWTSTPGKEKELMVIVCSDGVYEWGCHISAISGVRPLLHASINLTPYKKITFKEHTWTVISKTAALCDDFIFMSNYCDINLDEWFGRSEREKFLRSQTPEKLYSGMMSDDGSILLDASNDILRLSTMNIENINDLFKICIDNFDKLEKHANSVDVGGFLLPNKRFVTAALRAIESVSRHICPCNNVLYVPHGFTGAALNNEYGFVVTETIDLDKYTTKYIVRCPHCGAHYAITEAYTGHMYTEIRCSRLKTDSEQQQ